MTAAEPTELRPKRVAVSFSEREHAALQEMAVRERIPLAKAVLRIVRGHLATGRPAPAATGEATGDRATASPGWLPPTEQAQYAKWARDRAAAVHSLLDRYPDELAGLRDDWHRVAAVREQLWALSWRAVTPQRRGDSQPPLRPISADLRRAFGGGRSAAAAPRPTAGATQSVSSVCNALFRTD